MARSGRRGTGSNADGPNANGPNVSRRNFMAGAAVAGAAGVVAPQEAARAATAPVADVSETTAPRPSALRPIAHVAAAETGVPKALGKAEGPDGSDFMVDVIKTLNIDYVCSNPASSFRGLHESLIDYGSNKSRSSSPARTRNPRSAWPTATSRPPESR
jgi:acetolactate synthase I/II/III large subunit